MDDAVGATSRRGIHAFAPGRTELAGNHTDHEWGRVIAATISQGVNLDAQPNDKGVVRVESAGFEPFSVELTSVEPRAEERESPAALVRGIAAGLSEVGMDLHGFDARITSTLPVGGGLSSSAAFELVIGTTMALLSSAGHFDPTKLALIAQRAERDWFGKPCGLMDQLAIAHGGIVEIDFADSGRPQVRTIDFDFAAAGYAVCLVDVGCDHSRFTDEYARIPRDMQSAARICGKAVLGQVDEATYLARLEDIRTALGDRAALRGLHFYRESRLVDERADALRRGDMDTFLRATALSGASSAQYLQNVSCDVDHQPAMIALALAERALGGRGACRIHGGGFGGSIQAFVPTGCLEEFVSDMEEHLGTGCCRKLETGGRGAGASWM